MVDDGSSSGQMHLPVRGDQQPLRYGLKGGGFAEIKEGV